MGSLFLSGVAFFLLPFVFPFFEILQSALILASTKCVQSSVWIELRTFSFSTTVDSLLNWILSASQWGGALATGDIAGVVSTAGAQAVVIPAGT
jgi:hypothetical protein